MDFHDGFLIVRHNVVRKKLTTAKNNKIRRAGVSDTLITALLDLNRQRKEEWLKQGKNEIPDWVFCNEDGGWIDPSNVKDRHFSRCLEKAGLRRIRFHDLRHTFASLLLQNRESLAVMKSS